MALLLSICLYTAVGVGLLALFGFLTGRFFTVDRPPSAVVYCDTEDGWHLGMSRYRPKEPLHGAPPVVLCADVGLSGALFDLHDEVSLARFLADQGHDVWVVDLRGRGRSEKPRLWGRRRCRWTFDDFVEFDVPAALAAIARETGHDRVQWVGHGLGAAVALAACSGVDAPHLTSLVGLSLSVQFRHPGPLLTGGVSWLLRRIWSPSAVRVLAPLLGRVNLPPFRGLQNRDNVDGPIYRRALLNGVCPLPRAEVEQYAGWLDRDRFASQDGRVDYRKHMKSIDFPVMILGGRDDPLAPRSMVEATLELLESAPQTALVSAGRRRGLSADYGRLDLVLGRNARRDIYPHVLAWLDRRCGAELPDDRPRPPRTPERSDTLSPDDGQADDDNAASADPTPPLLASDTPVTTPPMADPDDDLELDDLFAEAEKPN